MFDKVLLLSVSEILLECFESAAMGDIVDVFDVSKVSGEFGISLSFEDFLLSEERSGNDEC